MDIEEIRAFLANPAEKRSAFWYSGALVWIDWREEDADIPAYFNEKLPPQSRIDFAVTESRQKRGFDLLLFKNGVSAPIPYAEDRADRDTTLRSLQAYLFPEYQIRCCTESLGSDTLGFCLLSTAQWGRLEQEFGAESVANSFAVIQTDSVLFN